MNRDDDANLDRRQLLRDASLIGVGAAAGLGAAPSSVAAEPSLLAGTCTLTASQISGPFYRDLNLLRKDITEGQPGIPLHLFIRVLDVDGCTPLAGAEVDVWHSNVSGIYSNFASQGTPSETWLRGVQFADASGIARFRTIYPGWYGVRTTHLHAKVYPQTGWELTTQLYFHDALNEEIYRLAPYAIRGPKVTSNAADPVFRPDLQFRTKVAADPSLAGVLVAAGITLVVDRP